MAKTVTRSQHRGDPSLNQIQKDPKSSCCCKTCFQIPKEWSILEPQRLTDCNWFLSRIQTAGFKFNLSVQSHHMFKIVKLKFFLNATAGTSELTENTVCGSMTNLRHSVFSFLSWDVPTVSSFLRGCRYKKGKRLETCSARFLHHSI